MNTNTTMKYTIPENKSAGTISTKQKEKLTVKKLLNNKLKGLLKGE